jgi:cold shock CspA family protein
MIESGKIKFFNRQRGGYLIPDDGGRDVYIDAAAVGCELRPGLRVTYILGRNENGRVGALQVQVAA